jgi:pantoate--beta-alanine ligase
MQVVSTRVELRDALAAMRRAGKSIGLVPTMGALHEGHLSLVDAARRECDFVVTTIFVNPTQFGPHEDLQKYPRNLEADLANLKARGVDLVFTPTTAEMYASDYATYVDVGPIADRLEGKIRPTHFRGVATVVLKFFHLIPADRAYFGQKDFQQSLVIQQMVTDLNVPIEIRVCPTIREPDGLAMSSRNAYLSADERRRASAISRGLRGAIEQVKRGTRNASQVLGQMRATLAEGGIDSIDYVVLVDPKTLADVASIDAPTLAAIAVRVGTTRLIDNELLTP